jgi:uncharacterized repeat protein (TIGR01451 family)
MKRKPPISPARPSFKKRPLLAERLEDRVLLSADPLAALEVPDLQDFHHSPDILQTLIHQALHSDQPTVVATETPAIEKIQLNQPVEKASASKTTLISADDTQVAPEIDQLPQRHEIAFIDSNISNYQDLIKDLQSKPNINLEIVILDGSKDGLQQITETLNKSNASIDAIHIFSHGSNANLEIGQTHLNTENLKEHTQDFESWKTHLTQDADILIYGCKVTATETGVEFVKKLSELTDADIAASSNDTAPEILGGDFILETHIGKIETTPFSSQAEIYLGGTAKPVVSLGGMGDHLLNKNFNFSISFQNDDGSYSPSNPTNTGYGPVVDLIVPREVKLGQATYLGYPLNQGYLIHEFYFFKDPSGKESWISLSPDWEAGGQKIEKEKMYDTTAFHPFQSNKFTPPSTANLKTGDRWYVVQIPFGSFIDNQPVATITFANNELKYNTTSSGLLKIVDTDTGTTLSQPIETGGARYDHDYTFSATPGFRFGQDALDNQGKDPSIKGDKITGVVTPKIITVTKTGNAPEAETATGKDYFRTYTVTVNVAPDVTVAHVGFEDTLPTNLRYLDELTAGTLSYTANEPKFDYPLTTEDLHTNNGATLTNGSLPTDSTDGIPDNVIRVFLNNPIVGKGDRDAVFKYDVYVPEYQGIPQPSAGGVTPIPVLPPSTGVWANSTNVVGATAIYVDNDRGDGGTKFSGTFGSDGSYHDDIYNNITHFITPSAGNSTTFDVNVTNVESGVTASYSMTDKPIAIQKSVKPADGSSPILPGTTLEYTLSFQVSDYFAFDDVVVKDTFSDGQRLNTQYTPKLIIDYPTGADYSANFTGFSEHSLAIVTTLSAGELTGSGSNFDWKINSNPDYGTSTWWSNPPYNSNTYTGETVLTFRVSDELTRDSGQLRGGGFAATDDYSSASAFTRGDYSGQMTGKIIFQTVIQENFSDIYLTNGFSAADFTGDKSVDSLDELKNHVTIHGALLNPHNGYAPLDASIGDDSFASVVIEKPAMTKSIYAINDSTSYLIPPRVAPGDTVTYRLTVSMPAADSEGFIITDYLPLPVFDMAKDGYKIVDTSLNITLATNDAPNAGHVVFGPADTFHQLYGKPGFVTDHPNGPDISVNAAANTVILNFGKFDADHAIMAGADRNKTLDLLISVQVADRPFAKDGFFLTNQADAAYGNTKGTSSSTTNIVQIFLTQPDISIKKGAVASTRPGTDFIPGVNGLQIDPVQNYGGGFTGLLNSDAFRKPPATNDWDANITDGADGGDVIRFAVSLENKGTADARDVVLQDSIPAGYKIPATGLDIKISDGKGKPQVAREIGWYGKILTTSGKEYYIDSDASTLYWENAKTLTWTPSDPTFSVTATFVDVSNNTYFTDLTNPETYWNTSNTFTWDNVADPSFDFTGFFENAGYTYSYKSDDISKYVQNAITYNFASSFVYQDETRLNDATAFQVILYDDTSTPAALGKGQIPAADSSGTQDGSTSNKSVNDMSLLEVSVGTNIAVMTYELKVTDTIQPGSKIVNQVTLLSYAGHEGGLNLKYFDSTSRVLDGTGIFVMDNSPSLDIMLNPTLAATMWFQDSTTTIKNDAFISDKSVVKTDQTATNGLFVTPGEVVTYRLEVNMNDGLANNLTLTDIHDKGLTYIANSAKIYYYGQGLTGTFDGSVQINGGASYYENGNTLNAGDIDIKDGSTLIFKFDSVYNKPNPDASGANEFTKEVLQGKTVNYTPLDTSLNRFVIEYDMKVLNQTGIRGDDPATGGTNEQTQPKNKAILQLNSWDFTSKEVTLTVIEPDLTLTHSLLSTNGGATGTADAGDNVTFNIVLGNNGGLGAWGVEIKEPIDLTKFTNIAENVTPNGWTYSFENLINISDGILDTVVFKPSDLNSNGIPDQSLGFIDKNQSVTFSFTGKLTDNVAARETLETTAYITKSSNLPNEVIGERTLGVMLDGAQVGGNLTNDYSSNAVAIKPIAIPEIAKGFATADINGSYTTEPFTSNQMVVVGEGVYYDIKVTLPEGTTQNLRVIDNVPLGMRFDPSFNNSLGYQIITNFGDGTFLTQNFSDPNEVTTDVTFSHNLVTGVADDGKDVTFSFGNVVVQGDNTTTNNSFVIRTKLIATDVMSNQDGSTLINRAALNYTDPDGTDGTSTPINVSSGFRSAQPVTIIEPSLTITKTTSAGANLDAGDNITYQIIVKNNSSVPAFDLSFRDIIDNNITNLAIDSVSGDASLSDFALNGQSLTFSNSAHGTLDLSTNQAITLTFHGQLSPSLPSNTQLSNKAEVWWTSIDGTTNPDERTGADVNNPTTTIIDGTLNNYGLSSSIATTVTNTIQIGKTLINSTVPDTTGNNLAIGEIATYRIDVTLSEGVVPNLKIADNIPDGMEFIGNVSLVSTADATNGLIASFNGSTPVFSTLGSPFGSGSDVTFSFNQISVASDNIATNNAFYLTYQTKVLKDPVTNFGDSIAHQTVLDNTASHNNGDATAGLTFTPSSVHAVIVEPSLTFTKSISNDFYDASDWVTMSLVVSNQGLAKAYEVSLTDKLDSRFIETQFSLISNLSNGFTYNFDASTGDLKFYNGTLDFTGANSSATFTFALPLDTTVSPGTTIYNTGTATTSTLPGSDSNERQEPTLSSTDHLVISKYLLDGTVYIDFNNDGTINGSDSGISGVAVTLTGYNHLGTLITEVATTNASGYYKFDNLRPSDTAGYTLTENQPAAFLDGKETAGDKGGTVVNTTLSNEIKGIHLPDNQTFATVTATSYNFGELPKSEIKGYVWNDSNNDGTKNNSETGIAGITIALSGTNDWGTVNTTHFVTDSNGNYTFDQLRPGNYTLVELNQPTGFMDGKDNVGTLASGTPHNETLSNITLGIGQSFTDYRFGEVLPSYLSGYVWEDKDNDGVMETGAGEPMIKGATVILSGIYKDNSGNDATYNLTTTTNSSGFYEFVSFYPATNGYTLTEILPATYLDGKDSTGTINTIAGGSLSTVQGTSTDTFVFSTHFAVDNRTGVNYNFGEIKANVLTGLVYEDKNNDGSYHVGVENPISGVTLILTGTDDLGAFVSLTFTTGNDGEYTFGDLRPSTLGYTVREIQPANYIDGKDSTGTNGGGTASALTLDLISGIFASTTITDTTAQNYNFGELKPNILIGRVWNDKDNDGSIDSGETGIGNVTLTLIGNSDVTLETYTVITDSSGFYTFTNIRPSDSNGYTLTQHQPTGFLDGTDLIHGTGWGTVTNDKVTGITFLTDQTAASYDFGEIKASQLIGKVWHDLNNDGSINNAETGIANVTLTLSGTNDHGLFATTIAVTDADGNYTFVDLRPGVYKVTESQPTAYLDGKDATQDITTAGFNYQAEWTTGHDVISQITIGTDQTAQRYNFGEILPSKLTGFVYKDLNNDGTLQSASETGISGVTLTLTGTNDFGVLVSLTATTDVNGKYDFTGLRPSNNNGYQIKESQPSDYFDGKEQIGNLNSVLSGSAESSSLDIIHFTSTVHFDATNYNFGELPPNEIHGIVWSDKNNDGTKDTGETGIAGVTVALQGTDYLGNNVSISFVTQTDGSFHFTNLPAGHYKLIEMNEPSHYIDGKDVVGSPSYGLVGKEGTLDAIFDISLDHTAGAILNNYRFGEIVPIPISGYVWNDKNNDGVMNDGTDAAISGVVITLEGSNDLTSVILHRTTDASGYYGFEGLRPGTYTLTEHQPSGFLDGTDRVFDSTARATPYASFGSGSYLPHWNDGSDQFASITLNENTPPQLFFDFAELRPSKLTGEVWHDIDNDGSIDTGETGISGAVLTLSGINDLGATHYIFTTNTDGKYTFAELRPGNYQLIEPVPNTFIDGRDQTGSHSRDGSTISGGILTTANNTDTFAISLTEGMTASGYNFGEVKPSTFSGRVWEDFNNNNVIDSGESGISGVVLTLTGIIPNHSSNDFTFLVTTDTSGFYTFTNLVPATYQLTEPKPAGFIDNKDQIGTINGNTLGNIVSDRTNRYFVHFTFLADDSTGLNYNFGEIKPYHLNGVVYHDVNNDGSFNSMYRNGHCKCDLNFNGNR